MSQKRGALPGSRRMSLACQRCRRRKTKCDQLYPKCSTCRRLGVECLSSQQYAPDVAEGLPRGFIEKLEQEARTLELEASRIASDLQTNSAPASSRTPSINAVSYLPGALHDENHCATEIESPISNCTLPPRWSLLSEAPPGTSGYQRPSLFESMVNCALSADNSDPRLSTPTFFRTTLSLRTTDSGVLSQILNFEAETYNSYLDCFFKHIHSVLPFLDEQDVHQTIHILRSRRFPDRSKQLILCLVLSIGACCQPSSRASFRKLQHSRDLFLYVSEALKTSVYKEDTDMARILILLTLYSLIHPGGGSTWHLRGLAIRICITLGLNHESSLRIDDTSTEKSIEQRRLVFWCIYGLDRWVSLALGRPFGIQNWDITTELPRDEYLGAQRPRCLFYWAYKISEIKQSNQKLSPQDIDEISQALTPMESGGQLFCLLVLQTVAWVTCPPYLSMDDRGLSLATKLSSVYINILSEFITDNGVIFWIWGYGVFHSALIQVFASNIIRTTRPDQSDSLTFESIPKAIQVLQRVSGEFSGLGKHVDLLTAVNSVAAQEQTARDRSIFHIDFLLGTNTYNICKAALALCSM